MSDPSEFPLTIPGERERLLAAAQAEERDRHIEQLVRHALADRFLREIWWRHLSDLGLYSTTAANNADIYRAEGRRAAALELRSLFIRNARDLYRLLEDEALEREFGA